MTQLHPPISRSRVLWPAPLPVRLAATAFVGVLVPVYWRHYGPANFLWFSDLGLFGLTAALWLRSRLLVSALATGVLLLEVAWSLDFLLGLLTGGHLIGLTPYMFDADLPLYLRALSLFHLPMPVMLLWLLARWGYDRRGLAAMSALAAFVIPLSYLVSDPAFNNINWVHGLGSPPWRPLPPTPWLLALVAGLPLAVYLPTHLLLRRLFAPRPV